jgi:hypothetical protein
MGKLRLRKVKWLAKVKVNLVNDANGSKMHVHLTPREGL